MDEIRPTLQQFGSEDFEELKNASQQFRRQIRRLETRDRQRIRQLKGNQDDISNLQVGIFAKVYPKCLLYFIHKYEVQCLATLKQLCLYEYAACFLFFSFVLM